MSVYEEFCTLYRTYYERECRQKIDDLTEEEWEVRLAKLKHKMDLSVYAQRYRDRYTELYGEDPPIEFEDKYTAEEWSARTEALTPPQPELVEALRQLNRLYLIRHGKGYYTLRLCNFSLPMIQEVTRLIQDEINRVIACQTYKRLRPNATITGPDQYTLDEWYDLIRSLT